MRRGYRIIGIALAAVALGGCERGCLASWLSDRGVGGATPESAGRGTPAQPLDLGGIDCSDGLLRCIEGQVEASRLAHIPNSCVKTGGAEKRGGSCTCPWDSVAVCPSGCVEDGVEIVAWPDAGSLQLCRPEGAVARPLSPAESASTEICASEGFACVNEVVRLCERPGQPVRLLGRCLNGCQTHIEIDPGETMNPNGVLSILCRRDHAERK